MVTDRLYYLISPIVFIALWYLFTLHGNNKLFIASPTETFTKFRELLFISRYYQDIWYTLIQTLSSFLISVTLGVLIGIIVASSNKVHKSLEVFIEFSRSIPSAAIFPLFLLLFGIGFESRIVTSSFVCMWLVMVNTIYGIKHTSRVRTDTVKILGANKIQVFFYVTLWETLPYILAAMRLCISLSLVVIILTEMLVSPRFGIGVRIFELQQYYKIPELFAYIITIGIIGFSLNRVVIYFEKKIIHWTNKQF